MIHKNAGRSEWQQATPDERREYVTRACQRCAQKGLGMALPSLVEEGITEFFTAPLCHNKPVHFIFGEVFAAITKLGHYRSLLDQYRKGP